MRAMRRVDQITLQRTAQYTLFQNGSVLDIVISIETKTEEVDEINNNIIKIFVN